MMTFLKKNWGKIILSLLLILIIFLNFKWGYFILGNDNYSPEEDPLISVQRYLQEPAWRSYRGLGVPSDSEQIDIFRSFLFLGLNQTGIPLWFISQAGIWLVFFCGPWFMAVLNGKVFGFNNKKHHNWWFLLSGLLYLSNLLLFWLFYSPLKPFVFVWGFLPMFLVASFNLVKKWNLKNSLFFLLSLMALSGSFMVPTLFIVVSILIVGFYWQFWRIEKNIKKIIILLSIYIVWQMYWLVPFSYYVKTNSAQLTESIINKEITPGTIQDEIKYNKWNNIPRFVTSWIDSKNDEGEFLFNYSNIYNYNGLFVLISYLPFGLILFSSIYLIKKYKTKYLPLIFIWWMGYFLIKSSNPPLGSIYVWMQENVPLFRQVFRWGSSKFWPMILVTMPILVCFSLEKLEKFRKVFLVIIPVFCLMLLIYIFPVFKGQLINDRDFVKIPDEYYQLKGYLENVDNKGRVYLAPESNMLYFKNHDWGFFGSVFWSYFIKNPIMEKALITGSKENEEAFEILTNHYYSADPDLFYKTLSNYKIDWIIGDRSLTNKGNGYRYDWEMFSDQIENNSNFEKAGEWGKLSLYRVKPKSADNARKIIYFGHDDKSFIQSKILMDEADFTFGNEGEIVPILLKPDEIEWNNNELTLVHKYKGSDYNYVLQSDNWDSGLKIIINGKLISETPTNNRLEIKLGDEIKIIIPNDGFDISSVKKFGAKDGVVFTEQGMIINNKNNGTGFYREISTPILTGKLMMVAIEAENKKGIPWEVNFRETKKENKLFRYYGQMLKNEEKILMFEMRDDWKNYVVEVMANARGKENSINIIKHFWLLPINNDWLKVRLVPENVNWDVSLGNNQAKHQGWTNSDEMAINGWEQGYWGNKKPIFWSNYLTWCGWIIDLLLVAGCLFFGWKSSFGHAKGRIN